MKYTAVAADVKNEKEVWLTTGSLFDAIRASISLPLFLTSFSINGVELIDGGVLNPKPIAPVFSDNSDYIIAVNLGAKSTNNITTISAKDNPSKLKSAFGSMWKKDTKENKTIGQSGMYQIADQAFDAMQNTIARQILAAYPPDVLIEIERNACGTLDFHKAEEMIELGYKKAGKAFKAK